MTSSCRTAFRLLAHICLLQYNRSSNVLACRRALSHISARYPRISFSWTQWAKNNKRPNYSEELKRVLARPSFHYANYPWSFFFFMWNLVTQDVVTSLIYFFFIYTFFYIYLIVLCVNVMEGSAQVLDQELNLFWTGFLGMVFHMLLAFQINVTSSKCCIQHNYYSRQKSQDHVMTIWE